MSGLEFIAAVAKVPAVASIPIVMVTASGSESNKKVAWDANPDLAGYVVKPYTAASLIRTIEPYIK